MLSSQITSPMGHLLSNDQIIETLYEGLEGQFQDKKLLVLLPDHTRTLPLPFLFRELVKVLHKAKQLDFMVALGTHPPLDEAGLNKLIGVTAHERMSIFKNIGLYNHAWDKPSALTTIGTLSKHQIKELAGENWHPSLPDEVNISINTVALTYDHIIILGPTFPHEVVGFSGGAKYLFPGISGAEMINAMHWLGALAGVVNTIGNIDTPARAMIQAATEHVHTPLTLIALVVEGDGLSGLFIGDHLSAWRKAAALSVERHIHWCEKPYQRVLSCAAPMYDELWTAAKAMYKIEPAVKVGGEVIIYAPHLDAVSHVHGKFIHEVGYHILPYFLNNWDKFKHYPLGVLAHSTHLRGSGVMENGIEKPNVRVTLASKIPQEDCERLNLHYLDPSTVRVDEWRDREEEGLLFVLKAGEILYRKKK